MTPPASGFSAEDLSVVIPTRGRRDTLELTLTALAGQTVTGFEIIVVVDGADQELPERGDVRVFQQEHRGPGVARNLGTSVSDRALILFMGDDMVPESTFVARHLAVHQTDPADEVAVLGRIVWHPAVPDNRLHRWLAWSGALFDYASMESEGGGDVGWGRFYSSNVSLKRKLFLEAGGFDPDFVFDYEDLDMAWRLGQLGMRLFYEREALVRHLHPYDWAAVERRYVSRASAEHLMMEKHDWFRPWFHDQITEAARQPRAARPWTVLVDRIPPRATRLRAAAERRANRYYLQRLAPSFMATWEAAGAEHQWVTPKS